MADQRADKAVHLGGGLPWPETLDPHGDDASLGGEPSHSDPVFRDQRRRAVIASPTLIGLDHVEVERVEAVTHRGAELWDLHLHFLPAGEGQQRDPAAALPRAIEPANVRIELGERSDPAIHIRHLEATGENIVTVRVERDFEPSESPTAVPTQPAEELDSHQPIYNLELIGLPRVDRFFSKALFAFRDGSTGLGLPNELPPRRQLPRLPEIDYLAKDYQSFRQLMLERLKRDVPSWQERNAADLGVTLVELLAYAGDYLSYYQDAVATEAYLATARQRISIRRHTRLIDYRLHQGANARCWVQIKIAAANPESDHRAVDRLEPYELPAGTEVLTSCGRVPGLVERGSRDELKARAAGPLVFQTLYPARLHPHHNRIEVYTWGATTYTLRAGTTRAALVGHLRHLHRGDVLIFERQPDRQTVADPGTKTAAAHPVRLAHTPSLGIDASLGEDDAPSPITEIEWLAEDALELDLQVAAMIDGKAQRLACVRGNNVLVDHGETYFEILPAVVDGERYAPRLRQLGLTFRVPWDQDEALELPARGLLEQDPRSALPALELHELAAGEANRFPDGVPLERLRRQRRERWQPRQDLLSSDRFSQDFVVETDDQGYAHLRFGDDQLGLSPFPGTRFQAVYRIGSGPSGNIGANALRHIVLGREELEQCADFELRLVEARNPLAGHGGSTAEDQQLAQHYAPQALHSGQLRRCVIEDDYVRVAESHPEVERAIARLHWNGSSWTAFLYVQRPGQRPLDRFSKRRLTKFFAPYLMADCEVELRPPYYVPLDLCFKVWPANSTLRSNLRRRLLAHIEHGDLPFLAPDYFTFGKPLYLSEVVSQIMDLPEVGNVEPHVFKRWGEPSRGELEQGEIALGPLEIAVVRNDPSAPHWGAIRAEIGELV